MDLKELIKKVKIATEEANVDPGDDPRTYTVKIGKIRRAKEDLKELFIAYRNEIRSRVVFIIPKGEGVTEFSKIASEELGCFSVKAEAPFEDTIKNINPALYDNKPFNASLFNTLSNYFQEVADDMGLLSYPMPVFKAKFSKNVTSREELLQSTKDAFVETVGSEFVGHYAVNKVALEAIKEDFSGKIVPIVLSTEDAGLVEKLEEDLKRITVQIHVINTKKDMTAKEVESSLSKIKKSITKK